ncbi:AVAST type 1 anti-phage system protease Avs1b [Planctomicrobium piriforme]|uniref:Trypsin-like peptidase domain-containing protein n=1 Tax=Planctomicrobium piriforme TaxID=1576369 RepID=A0A1I3E028_9PLAN|nr:AVAST type 1 anti-phage system protease Avs1b [Planctomicrobium piriforme]SFH92342.1 Trypsin-like peptidase domain-containing protein [Planctomicrobium piriforme]
MLESVVRAACCKVTCGSEIGTGFLISPTVILTVRHCILPAIETNSIVDVQLHGSTTALQAGVQAAVVDHEADLDLAILSLSQSCDHLPLHIMPELPREGTGWLGFGFPGGAIQYAHRLAGTISQVLDAPVAKSDIQLAISHDTAIADYSGLSGSPVVIDGECIGILRFKSNQRPWCISIKAAEPFLTRNNISFATLQQVASKHLLASRNQFQSSFEGNILASPGKYFYLQGAHGIGKTTFCKHFKPESERIRHLGTYCVRDPDSPVNAVVRAQADQFFDWLQFTISSQLVGKPERMKAIGYADMAKSTAFLFDIASQHAQQHDYLGILFIDGIDDIHNLGDERLPAMAGLLPSVLPPGIAVVLASPNYLLLVPSLGGLVSESKVFTLPPLGAMASRALCVGQLKDGDNRTASFVDELCSKANGHPLYLQYLIRFANEHPEENSLSDFPVLNQSIEDYYQVIWMRLSSDIHSVSVLSVLARLRGTLSREQVSRLFTSAEAQGFSLTMDRIAHLLTSSEDCRLYHESFASFLLERTNAEDGHIQKRLAAFCDNADVEPYCTLHRVHHHARAVPLGDKTFECCNQGWIDLCADLGAHPDVVLGDIEEILELAMKQGVFSEMIRLLLLRSRAGFRYDTLLADAAAGMAEALCVTGRPDHALKYLMRYGRLIVSPWEALRLAVVLMRYEHTTQCVRLLEVVERNCLDAYSTGRLPSDVFIELSFAHAWTVLLLRESGERNMEYYAHIVHHAAEALKRGATAEDAEWIQDTLERLGCVANTYFFTVKNTYVDNSAMREYHKTLAIKESQLLSMRLQLVRDHCRMADVLAYPVANMNSGGLLADVEELLSFGQEVILDEISDLLDALILLGASGKLVEKVIGPRDLPAPEISGLREQNGVDAAIAKILDSVSAWRVVGFRDENCRLPPIVPITGEEWEAGVQSLFVFLVYFDGAARRAKANHDGPTLDRLSSKLDDLIYSPLEVSLADRILWERSYAIPEQCIPILYEIVAGTLVDCFPNYVEGFIGVLIERFSGQFGLYSEGFHECLFRVIARLNHSPGKGQLQQSLLPLARKFRDHLLIQVENRHELVPKLLRLTPIFASIGAHEEASELVREVLHHSMGPTWYKEDQFSLLTTALKGCTSGFSGSAATVAGYLERASGEMTFQRFIRQEKSDLIGVMASQNHFQAATAYFVDQSYGDLEHLFEELGGTTPDAPDWTNAQRHPGAGLYEQQAMLSFVCHATQANPLLRWGILEIFLSGDSRHFEEYAEAFASIVNETGNDNDSLSLWVVRIGDLVSSGIPLVDRYTFAASFLEAVEDAYALAFSDLVETISNLQLFPRPLGSIVPTPMPAQVAASEATDEFYHPGVFGKQNVFPHAERLYDEAIQHLNLGNKSAAKSRLVEVLKVVQEGEWPLWNGPPHEVVRKAELALASNASSASEISQLLCSIIKTERFADHWRIAEQAISLCRNLMSDSERSTVFEAVANHFQMMIGNIDRQFAHFTGLLTEDETHNDDVLRKFVLKMTDHPSWPRREKASEVALWLSKSDKGFLRIAASTALQMSVGYEADVACGILENASYRNPMEVWQEVQKSGNCEVVKRSTGHLSRLVTLMRIARRAANGGQAGAATSAELINNLFRVGNIVISATEGLALPDWARCVEPQWRRLEELKYASQSLFQEVEEKLSSICSPFDISDVYKMESMLLTAFSNSEHAPMKRWKSKVLFSLNCALCSFVSRDDIELVETALRVWNPSAPCASRMPFVPPLLPKIRELIKESSDYSAAIGTSEEVFLHLLEYVREGELGLTSIEVTAVVVSVNRRKRGFFVPRLTAKFPSRVRPEITNMAEYHETCVTVDPEMIFWGSFTPAIPTQSFLDKFGHSAVEFKRANWKSGSRYSHFEDEAMTSEGCLCSLPKNVVHLADEEKMAWIIQVNGEIVAMVDGDNRELY